jgi:hypothetical protein
MIKDGCTHFYFFNQSGAKCLHELFADGYVGAVSREQTPYNGLQFYIWRDKLIKNKKGRYAGKYKLFGARTRLSNREQVLLAIDLADKHKIQKVNL